MTLYILAFLFATLLFVNLVFLKDKSFGKKFSYSIAIVAAFMVIYVGIVTFSFGKPERPIPKKSSEAVVGSEGALDADHQQLTESHLSKSDYETSRSDDQNSFLTDTLTFASINGTIELPTAESTVVFKNNTGEPHDEDIETFKYLGSYTGLKKYLLEVHLYEDTFYLLVDQQTGLRDTLQGMPYFSPDHSKIFSSQEVFEDGDNDQLMVSYNYIYSFASDKTELLTTATFKWLVRECYWNNNQTVYIKASTSEQPTSYFYKKISVSIQNK